MFAAMNPSLRTYSRRNALVPLPLLPPVPQNAIVTSVRIVHNTSEPVEFDAAFTFSPYKAQSSPTSVKRPRTTRRRSTTSCAPCDTTADASSSSLLNPNRKPRSTIVVTVRLANSAPTTAASSARPSNLAPSLRRAATTGAQIASTTAAMLARKAAHRPRVSSPLASSVITAGLAEEKADKMDAESVSPLSSPVCGPSRPVVPLPRMRLGKKASSKKGSKGKTTSRIGMLRWAILNNSSPEVGRRILCMGVRLAQEIWEAERAVEEIEVVEEMETAANTEEQQENREEFEDAERLKVAEECIRELEEMEVDTEDIEMEAPVPSSVEEPVSEKSTEHEQTNAGMEVDAPGLVITEPAAPAPVVIVAPSPKPLQVQVQLKIAVQVFSSASSAKKVQKESERSRRWFERIAL